jgi:prevent-host-death family protein
VTTSCYAGDHMEAIGVRELKAHLSEYLKRVQAGERLTVTDRGRAIATLTPVSAPASTDWVHSMVAAGHARWNGGKPQGLGRRIKPRGRLASRMVLEDRR